MTKKQEKWDSPERVARRGNTVAGDDVERISRTVSTPYREVNTMPTASLKPLRADAFGHWEANHLLRRAGFGGTPDQVRLLVEWGLDKSVDYLINYGDITTTAIKADDFRGDIMQPPSPEERLAYRNAQQSQDEVTLEKIRRLRQDRQRQDRQQVRSLQQWWLKRIIETPRPLEEKMTLFFHGHFATGYRTIENSYHMFLQNQTFRKHAVGNFAELCFQIIRDPAMLAYLDNNESHKRLPNENLARELMELFTLGEGNGYTESDIKEGAKALTGYSFEGNEFLFREDFHDEGQKVIFGKRGTFNGDDFVRLILGKPQCSEFISLKLYRFFVNDLPGPVEGATRAFVISLAKEMRQNKYELAPVLGTLFRSEHFYDEANVAAEIKSPVQLTVEAVRSLKTPVVDLNILVDALDLMGQNIFFPPSVKGWVGGRSWINTSTLFVRQNLLTHLLTGRLPSGFRGSSTRSQYDAMHLLSHLTKDANGEYALEETVNFLLKSCLGANPLEPRRETLMQFVRETGGRVNNELVIGMLCLITAMPEYQLC